MQDILRIVAGVLTSFGLKLLGAIALWLVGQRLIELVRQFLTKSLRFQEIEPTLGNYLLSFLGITLRVILVIALLGFLGLETTSFAALLAAAGVAIGAAWGGLLANFAAGVFLIIFRPFEVGNWIGVAGVVGIVVEIGIFSTKINTADNVLTIISNNKLFSENIQNFSANFYRRIDLTATIDQTTDPAEVIARLRTVVNQINNVLAEPAPMIGILELRPTGTLLAVRPHCRPQDYWQVYFDTNQAIHATLASYPPVQQYVSQTDLPHEQP